MSKNKKVNILDALSDKITSWMGTTQSIVAHTIFFVIALCLILVGVSADLVLLILTTIVSLEAIYLAIFIQRTVNKQREDIEDIEESIDEIEEDIEDITEDLDEVGDEHNDIAKVTVEKLEQPLDEVVSEIRESLNELKEEIRTLKK